MKWFKDLEPVIQYYIVLVALAVCYGVYTVLDKLIDKI